jgi:CheY-like chemotaxis protein
MSEKKLIFLIDDEIDLLEMTAFQFKAKGFEVVIAQNGVEGLEKLNEGLKPDLIILDMNMPQMGGVEFYQRICDDNDVPKFPVFVFTARANLESIFKEFNIEGFITKPFDINKLIEEVEVVLEAREKKEEKQERLAEHSTHKLLIVDESPENIIKVFEKEKYIVESASEITEALEKASQILPHLVLVRYDSKTIDVENFILTLKRMSKTKFLKVLPYSVSSGTDAMINKKIMEKLDVEEAISFDLPSVILKYVNDFFKENFI